MKIVESVDGVAEGEPGAFNLVVILE